MKEKIYVGNIKLDNKNFEYEIYFKKQKNIYMKIKDEKIIISSPIRVPIYEIENFIRLKQKWIFNTLDKQKNKVEIKKEKKYTDEEFYTIIKDTVSKYSKQMNLYPNKTRIKQLKYAWGSCTSNKNISFNSELIYYDKEVIEYVVVHELVHLKYMNHQKKFWDEVAKYIPNYKILRKCLKTYKSGENII